MSIIYQFPQQAYQLKLPHKLSCLSGCFHRLLRFQAFFQGEVEEEAIVHKKSYAYPQHTHNSHCGNLDNGYATLYIP